MDNSEPNFFIIGAAKAGTTSLHDLLRQHPQVFLPTEKEPAFFSDDEYFGRGKSWYLRTFFKGAAGCAARGEATPGYLFFAHKVAPRIHQFSSLELPKFIAIFRDPASLVYSYYWNSVREGRETLPFREALAAEPARMERLGTELERRGRMTYAYSRIAAYASQLSTYLDIFPRDRFLFLLTNDLADAATLLRRLQDFLGLPDRSDVVRAVRSNASALPRYRRLHQWLRGRSAWKDSVKPFIPRSIRYRLKLLAINSNLVSFNPPPLDEDLATSIRLQYLNETERLQDLIQRDLSTWLPTGGVRP
ncbi:MAG TPA: sulfotransferase [Anaerolineales bacterium]|nr:sulfotransferase [Anaerolineales bacterium]